MNRPAKTRVNQRRRPNPKGQAKRQGGGVDLWRSPAPLPDLDPISVPDDVGALIRSLGEPPMHAGNAAGHYFSTVIERAAAVALALALSADVVAGDATG